MQATTYTTEFHPTDAVPAFEPSRSPTALPSDRDRPEPLAFHSAPSINRVVVRLSLQVIHLALGLTDLSKLLANALLGLLRLR